jgi:hypothetical protein
MQQLRPVFFLFCFKLEFLFNSVQVPSGLKPITIQNQLLLFSETNMRHKRGPCFKMMTAYYLVFLYAVLRALDTSVQLHCTFVHYSTGISAAFKRNEQ